MGSKRMESTADLARWGCRFLAVCKRCDHRAEFSPSDLNAVAPRASQGWSDPYNLHALARRLRCSQCGSRKVRWGVFEPLPE